MWELEARGCYIDAVQYGNESRSINHYRGLAEEPNVRSLEVQCRGVWHVLMFAMVDIAGR